MNRNQSKNLSIGPHRINKISFSCCNDNKYILKDDYIRFSHFHKSSLNIDKLF